MAASKLVGAIVLVGGRSSRMGTDKASLVVNGTTMLDGVLQVVTDANIDVVAVAGSSKVPDLAPNAGPMGGIVSGWRYLRDQIDAVEPPDPVVVLSCDLPALSVEVVNALVRASSTTAHGAVAHDGERSQPLIAAYRPAALEFIDRSFTQGERSVRRCFEHLELARVIADKTSIADADTPSDLEGFEVQWPS